MHYADFILSSHGLLSRIWLAAHWDKKLNKNSVISTDLVKSIENILSPNINVALKTTGHLLLGVVKIYSRQTIYLLHDCSEALSIFSIQAKGLKSQNQINSSVNNRSRKNKTNLFISQQKSNQSRVEDITLQPPDDFLNEMMLVKEFDEQFNDVSQIETMRHSNQPSSLMNDISYEMARDQSIMNQNNVSNLFDTTDVPSLFEDKPGTTNQSMFSNINMDDFDMDNYPENYNNPNQLIDSALNNFTMGDGTSIEQSHKMMSFLNDPSKLDQIRLDSLESYTKPLQKSRIGSNSTVSRKRRLMVDSVNFITENDDQSLINFKNIINCPPSIFPAQIQSNRENIPPPDSYNSNATISLMTIRGNNSVMTPLAKRYANLLSVNYNSFQFGSQLNRSQNIEETTNDVHQTTEIDNYDFNEDFPTDYNNTQFDDTNNMITTECVDHTVVESEVFDLDETLDKSLEKYDKGDIAWSRNTANIAKNLLHIYTTNSNGVNFKKYITTANITTKKSVAQHFYSLLILQRENLFDIRQQHPYEDIIIYPSTKLALISEDTQNSDVSYDLR